VAKARAYGADSVLLAAQETTYGTAPASGYHGLDFKSTDLSSAIPLGDDPLLGRGRNAQDPYRGLVTDEGNVDIPLDVQGTGWWLTGLFGAPVTGAAVQATGSISFSGQPGPNSTITLNGVTWTFVSGTPNGNQTHIGVSLDATLTALATDLNASADVEIARCTHTADTANDQLDIEFDVAGTAGNAWTLAAAAASNGTPSAATLTGGGTPHVWESGSDSVPSYTLEIGHPKLVTPVFFRHTGVVFESLNFEMGLEGPANGRVALVAQGETSYATTIDDAPDRYTLQRFSQGRGTIKKAPSRIRWSACGRSARTARSTPPIRPSPPATGR
jgi:Phage tail tube protein